MWLGCQEKKAEGTETQSPNPVLLLATGAPVKAHLELCSCNRKELCPVMSIS